MKKKILLLAAVVLLLSIMTGGTFAYYTANGTARNVITSDGVDIEIEEWQQVGEDLVPYPGGEIPVMPATSVSKIVTVRNLDAQCFIRARLDTTVTNADGENVPVSPDVIHLTMNTDDWTEKDGWWYYGSPVNTNAVTEPLMTEVSFDGPNMTNEYQSCTLGIRVYAQAVQTAHNKSTALEALGWPEAE